MRKNQKTLRESNLYPRTVRGVKSNLDLEIIFLKSRCQRFHNVDGTFEGRVLSRNRFHGSGYSSKGRDDSTGKFN